MSGLRWMWREGFAGSWHRWAVYCVLVLAGSGLGSIPPLLLKLFIDQGLGRRDWSLILLLAVAWLAVPLTMGVLTGWRTQLQSRLVATLEANLRQRAYERILSADMTWVEARQAGEIAERLSASTMQSSGLAHAAIGNAIPQIATLIVVVAVTFSLNWRLGLILMAASAVQLPYVFRSMRTFGSQAPRWLSLREAVTARVVETVTALAPIRALGAAGEFREGHRRLVREFTDVQATAVSAGGWFSTWRSVVTACAVAAVLVTGAYEVLRGSLTAGGLIAFYAYALMVQEPVAWIGAALGDLLPRLNAETDRLREYFVLPAEADPPGVRQLPEVRGTVAFEDVWFRRGDRPVLNGITFTANPGEFVAIVGPTGTGKSTLLRLLLGFYPVEAGTIRLDGVPVATVERASLRRAIAWLPQEPFVLHGTVRDNLRLGNPQVDEDAMRHACAVAGFEEVLQQLPGGLDAPTTEGGRSLSGGERQRLALARLLLAQAPIVALDELAAHLDSPMERAIVNRIRAELQGRTLLVVSHRLAGIAEADKIVVLNEGRIEAIGTHSALLAESETYRRMWHAQAVAEA